MNKTKLSDSARIFAHYYLYEREQYDSEERSWKVELSEQFQNVFARDSVQSRPFVESLTDLFQNPKSRRGIIFYGGGPFYQHQRFLDLLLSRPDATVVSQLFDDLLYSQEPIEKRINRFKGQIDKIYKQLFGRETIQLNLISQFLGLSLPHEHYVYKSTEFRQAAAYFEHTGRSGPAGGVYDHYLQFAREIQSALEQAGLSDVDFIDVQTFVFREDLRSPADLDHERANHEKETAKAAQLSLAQLIERARKAKSVPPKAARRITTGIPT